MPPIVNLFLGDSLTLLNDANLRALSPREGKIFKSDAVVCDPPYGFDFAGDKDWDSFQDSRSLASAADDAAVFARFSAQWSYAAKYVLWPGAHLLAFCSDRTVDLLGLGLRDAGYDIVRMLFWLYASGQVKNPNDTRPGCEPIFVGRFMGEMGNLGDLNKLFKEKGRGQLHAQTWKAEDGKHPTNMLISEEAVALDEDLAQMVRESKASFFVPKPSAKDRDWGCADLPMQKKDNRLSHMTSNYTGKVVKDVMAQNVHPTVKPIEVMRRLIRLVTRPGGTVLDPFMGSGTCGVAAVLEGRNYIGIEREPDYYKIAETRINSALAEIKEKAA